MTLLWPCQFRSARVIFRWFRHVGVQASWAETEGAVLEGIVRPAWLDWTTYDPKPRTMVARCVDRRNHWRAMAKAPRLFWKDFYFEEDVQDVGPYTPRGAYGAGFIAGPMIYLPAQEVYSQMLAQHLSAAPTAFLCLFASAVSGYLAEDFVMSKGAREYCTWRQELWSAVLKDMQQEEKHAESHAHTTPNALWTLSADKQCIVHVSGVLPEDFLGAAEAAAHLYDWESASFWSLRRQQSKPTNYFF